MKKKVLSLLLVAAMGMSMLVGCGGGQTSGGNTQAPSGDGAKTEVTDVKPLISFSCSKDGNTAI